MADVLQVVSTGVVVRWSAIEYLMKERALAVVAEREADGANLYDHEDWLRASARLEAIDTIVTFLLSMIELENKMMRLTMRAQS